ncbi:hypothetical protein [Chryseobacterium takakiae]|uniref:Glucosyl transferase GtrII n=1 Tax=Chryseobacterium takakiae TaxID=1302685 RepID=A0A1M4ZMJ9_9FLAO|nr:hypothetical protein [Chryseobacterium takakiae]SHF19330.1 hypothetical protein SAMN05444408_110139 [Chryseobacterium takakiae]
MKKNIERDQLFLNISIIIYVLYISLSVCYEKILLADDLAMAYEYRFISQSYFSFICSFLDSSTMAARPVSGFVTATVMFISQYNEFVYWLGLFFFPLSLLVIYEVAQKILTVQLASLITLLYACSMIGTSIQFSAIMLNSNLATIFFCLSIYILYFHKNIFLSSLLFIASVLNYEIFLPLIFLHLFFIKKNKKRITFIIITLGTIIIFRKIIQPFIFLHSYQRDEIDKILDVKRVIQIFLYSAKLFLNDIFSGIYKSILNYKKLNFFEWIVILIITSLVYKIFSDYDFKKQLQSFKNLGIISLLAIFCGMSIFLFSSYIPTVFGFDNRNLGTIRLFHTIFIISATILLAIKLNLGNKIIAVFFAITASLFMITNISVKNSWIYANRFNHELFSKLKTAIDDNNIIRGEIGLDYDIFNELKINPNLTFREPVFFKNWEAPILCEMNGIDPGKIHVYNIENKKDCKIIFVYKNGKISRLK